MGIHLRTVKCSIKGLVQGVGFRPFVYRTAKMLNLAGTVCNCSDGVEIVLQGMEKNIEEFILTVKTSYPPASEIEDLEYNIVTGNFIYEDFTIAESQSCDGNITEISPDIAVCPDCLDDLKKQENRINYPFVNCTNCGPRFSIIKSLPYDRCSTTMSLFDMCGSCRNEYENPEDRRFHAQPVSCLSCGPVYRLHMNGRTVTETGTILKIASEMIDNGKIIALKGLGGYHLICNALDHSAVKRLREIKKRESKPFAVMLRNKDTAEKYVFINESDFKALSSWRRPIVLCPDRRILPSGINCSLSKTGAMLPYMPFHYLLFEELETDCIVATSGNFHGEPLITDNNEALEKFLPVTDCVITYNRDIQNRCDDSVLFTSKGKISLVRRSRGWTPRSISLDMKCGGILATGAELNNTFCIGRGNKAFLSQHIGDLKSYDTEMFFRESVKRFSDLFKIEIKKIVHDLHPDYLSTKYALESGLPSIAVQHHWAHIASTLAEHRINRKVSGFAFDGTGYGIDGAVWGGEVLICDLQSFERYSHLDYVMLPGGDSAVNEPWRMGLSYLIRAFGYDCFGLKLPLFEVIGKREIKTVTAMIENRINTPRTSSMGRLFDAVSAITGLCFYSGFESEAAMRLESEADKACCGIKTEDCYSFHLNRNNAIDVTPVIKSVAEDTVSGIPAAEISLKFHNTIAEIILFMAEKIRDEIGINSVSLSGGVFYNRLLLSSAENRLSNAGFEIYSNREVPSGDGGISLGQFAIAAAGGN